MPNLEIGCGRNPQPGYLHAERYWSNAGRGSVDIILDANCLPFGNGSFDSILMFGVVEHFGFFELQEVFLEIMRVLRKGGALKFDVPDFDWFVERYRQPELLEKNRDESWVLHAIFGGQDGPGQFHKWGWSERRMMGFLKKPNWSFSEIKMVGRQWRDPEENHLIWECVK